MKRAGALGGVSCLVVLALLAVSGPVRSGTLALRWDECVEGGGLGNKSFVCGLAIDGALCVPTIQLPAPVDSVIGVEWVVDLIAATPTLPDWWQFSTGACRPSALTASTNFAGIGACADPWNGQALALVQVYAPGEPRGGLNQARIICTSSVLAAAQVRLDAGTAYYPGVMRLSYTKSTGADACAGCTTPVCLVLNSMNLLRHPGASVQTLEYVPELGDPNQVSWQGAGGDCQLVPARNRTWGAIKSLYR